MNSIVLTTGNLQEGLDEAQALPPAHPAFALAIGVRRIFLFSPDFPVSFSFSGVPLALNFPSCPDMNAASPPRSTGESLHRGSMKKGAEVDVLVGNVFFPGAYSSIESSPA